MKTFIISMLALCIAVPNYAQTWTETSNMPNPVNSHSVNTLPNGNVIQIGGDHGFQEYSNEVNIYNLEANTWATVASYPFNIEVHRAFLTSDTTVLVIGGNSNGSSTDSVYSYNINTDMWTAKANLPKALESVSAVQLPDGNIFVTSGWNVPDYEPNGKAYLYDVENDSWETLEDAPEALVNSAIAIIDNGDIIIAGGLNASFSAVANTYAYNIESDTWTQVGNLPYALSGGAMCATTTNGGVCLIGGFDFTSTSFKNQILKYNTTDSEWESLKTLDYNIANGAIAAVDASTVLVAGGNNGAKRQIEMSKGEISIHAMNGVFESNAETSLDVAFTFNLNTSELIDKESLPAVRQSPTYCKLNDNRVFVSGGGTTDLANSHNTALIYEESLSQGNGTIKFTIVDAEDLAVSNASVSCDGQTVQTDANGIAEFLDIAYGTYGYTVEKVGYNTVSVTASDPSAVVVDNEVINVEVTLQEASGVFQSNEWAKRVNIYPNITTGRITIENTNSHSIDMILFNQMGQVVGEFKNIQGKHNIKLDLQKGMYLAKIVANEKTLESMKLIVK